MLVALYMALGGVQLISMEHPSEALSLSDAARIPGLKSVAGLLTFLKTTSTC